MCQALGTKKGFMTEIMTWDHYSDIFYHHHPQALIHVLIALVIGTVQKSEHPMIDHPFSPLFFLTPFHKEAGKASLAARKGSETEVWQM